MMFLSVLSRPGVRSFLQRPAARLTGERRARRKQRVVRFMEGVGLWMAMLLVLFVQRLYVVDALEPFCG